MKYLCSFVFLVLLSFALVSSVSAQQGSGNGGGTTGNGLGEGTTGSGLGSNRVTLANPIAANNVQELFQAIIDIVIVFAIPIIVFFIIYAGFLYVTARGNESTIQKAHMALLYALIGGLLILGARVLIEVVAGTVEGVTGNEVRSI